MYIRLVCTSGPTPHCNRAYSETHCERSALGLSQSVGQGRQDHIRARMENEHLGKASALSSFFKFSWKNNRSYISSPFSTSTRSLFIERIKTSFSDNLLLCRHAPTWKGPGMYSIRRQSECQWRDSGLQLKLRLEPGGCHRQRHGLPRTSLILVLFETCQSWLLFHGGRATRDSFALLDSHENRGWVIPSYSW